MKSIVQKLSGFAKFELDHKLGVEHFQAIVAKLSTQKDAGSGEAVFSKERMEKVLGVFSRAYKDNVVPFQGDLENELYKAILAAFREH